MSQIELDFLLNHLRSPDPDLVAENSPLPAQANDDANTNYSKLDQINNLNVKNLQVAWSFSTGVLGAQEGTPLVIGHMMYVHTPFPDITYALSLDTPGKIVWQDKPEQDPSARAVSCCDLVSRGLAYWPGDDKTPPLILQTIRDGHIEALNAMTGRLFWKTDNADIKVASAPPIAPYVVHDKAIVGSSDPDVSVRGYLTAYNVHDGARVWRAYAIGPDKDLLLSNSFNFDNPQYGQRSLGINTWEDDTWKVGGGANVGGFAYDSKTNLIYFRTGKSWPWNSTARLGDNKWAMSIFARDADTGEAKWAYQTRSDRWYPDGGSEITLVDQKVPDGDRRMLVYFARNGLVYNFDRIDGSLVSVGRIGDIVNEFKSVDLKTGQPVDDREYATKMDHLDKDICPSAMGYHNQGHNSYDPVRQQFFIGINHICMDSVPFVLPYRGGQFFVGETLRMYPGPRGDRLNYEGLGQVGSFDSITGRFKWQKMERFPIWSGTTATAGNVVFYGTLDGFIKARDSDTGNLLWKAKLPSGAMGYPITYTHKGIQYVAINYGVGGWPGVDALVDKRASTTGLDSGGAFKKLPDYTRAGGGVMVFSLNGNGPYSDPNVGEYERN